MLCRIIPRAYQLSVFFGIMRVARAKWLDSQIGSSPRLTDYSKEAHGANGEQRVYDIKGTKIIRDDSVAHLPQVYIKYTLSWPCFEG